MDKEAAGAIERALRERFGEALAADPALAGLAGLARIAGHRSHRRYLPRPVEPALLRLLCACALSAPSKSDLQQCDIVIVSDPAIRGGIAATIPDMPWIGTAPAFLVFVANGERLPLLSRLRGKPFPNDHLDAFFNAAVDAAIVLQNFVRQPAIDYRRTLDETLALAPRLAPLVADVPRALYEANRAGNNLLFEGAQGTLLDIDHGTYPFVTSSNCTSGGAATGAGVGPHTLHYVLGITKAYTTRVGSGPFPTELFDDNGRYLAERGHEFGSTTGRARRCGWFDAAALKRSIQINGVSGLCVTKLDVLDGMETLRVCVGYNLDGGFSDILPVGAETLAKCEPVYEEMPAWKESTVGIKRYEDLPENARAYLKRMEDLCEVPIDMISTGPDREETIVLRHPFN